MPPDQPYRTVARTVPADGMSRRNEADGRSGARAFETAAAAIGRMQTIAQAARRLPSRAEHPDERVQIHLLAQEDRSNLQMPVIRIGRAPDGAGLGGSGGGPPEAAPGADDDPASLIPLGRRRVRPLSVDVEPGRTTPAAAPGLTARAGPPRVRRSYLGVPGVSYVGPVRLLRTGFPTPSIRRTHEARSRNRPSAERPPPPGGRKS